MFSSIAVIYLLFKISAIHINKFIINVNCDKIVIDFYNENKKKHLKGF